MAHKYFYLYRPPCYGCQPNGFTQFDGGLPKKDWDSQHGKIHAFGWVEYPEPLTLEQAWKWELVPDDPQEWARMVFWEKAGRDADTATWMIDDYVRAYRDNTGYIPDDLREPTRILAEADHA